MVGAAEGGEEAVFFEEFQGAKVDLFVAAHGVHEGFLVFGEARGIEDDEVVFRLGGFEEVEDVGFDDFDIQAVELGVFAGGGAGGAGDIDGGDFCGAGFRAGEGEAALVGEAVEHSEAFGEFCDLGVGLKLVEVEAGFLAVDEVDFVGDAVGNDGEGAGVFAVDQRYGFLHALGFTGGRVVAKGDGFRGENFNQGVADEVFPHVHGEGGGLDAKVVSVTIDVLFVWEHVIDVAIQQLTPRHSVKICTLTPFPFP